MNTQTIQPPDYTAIKTKQNSAWGAGDYAKVGVTLQIAGEELAETLDLNPDSAVLDVAAGNGNATLAFARRFCDVTSSDYVQSLLDSGRERAQAEGLDVSFQVADAENLPFPDATFDAVVSTYGVMFTPNQKQSASEMMRVLRSGGKIGLANWTPDSFIGQLFKTLGRHIAPPPGVNSPALWGSREWIDDTFGENCEVKSFELKKFTFRYRSPEHFIDFFRTFYGPMQKAFSALDETGQSALMADILGLVKQFNEATDGSARIHSEYAEIMIIKH
ncbi:MAG: class I SAM-dependent methyltransferase [Rhizobiaceae bacterium]